MSVAGATVLLSEIDARDGATAVGPVTIKAANNLNVDTIANAGTASWAVRWR